GKYLKVYVPDKAGEPSVEEAEKLDGYLARLEEFHGYLGKIEDEVRQKTEELDRLRAESGPLEDELNEKEQRIVYLLLKDIRNMAKIPMDEYVAYEELLVEADDVWHTAKETSDFALFEPYLQKIFDTERRFAGYIEPEKDPYDHLLNEYEEGLTKETCDKFFATLKERLVPLIQKVGEMPPVDTSCIKGYFLQADQEKLAHWLMRTMAMDLDHIGLSSTEHPFTTSFGSHHDVRITTHYYPENVSFSMYSVIHEGRHALSIPGPRTNSPTQRWTAASPWASTRARAASTRTSSAAAERSATWCCL
ncbi:MAG: hypothetical protein IJ926_05175, partial [Firmicutes bacterium]|nr:hypothetical protein [Bacillota bacterium]